MNSEERQKRLEEFHKGYDVLDENLRKEKSRVMATLSEYFNREMILADECLIKGDESGAAAVYSHIAKVIDAALYITKITEFYFCLHRFYQCFLDIFRYRFIIRLGDNLQEFKLIFCKLYLLIDHNV
jgi:hypothetical protein